MWHPNRAQWYVIWIAAVSVIAAWPPAQSASLGIKAVRWLADPTSALPTLPEPLPMGLGDDGDAVAAHDLEESEYNRLYAGSWMMRTRLQLKAVEDPWDPTTERQILTGLGILSVLGVWRLGSRGKS